MNPSNVHCLSWIESTKPFSEHSVNPLWHPLIFRVPSIIRFHVGDEFYGIFHANLHFGLSCATMKNQRKISAIKWFVNACLWRPLFELAQNEIKRMFSLYFYTFFLSFNGIFFSISNKLNWPKNEAKLLSNLLKKKCYQSVCFLMNARFRPSITIAWSWQKIKRLNVSSYANRRMFTSFAIDSNRLYIFESIFMTVCFFFFYVSFLFNFGAMTLFITLNPLDLRARWCKQKVKTNKKNQNKCFQRS